jgi:hypothetical protein
MVSDHRHDDVDERLARLEALEARIVRLEQEAERRRSDPPGPHYDDSGSIHPELDDQTITP